MKLVRLGDQFADIAKQRLKGNADANGKPDMIVARGLHESGALERTGNVYAFVSESRETYDDIDDGWYDSPGAPGLDFGRLLWEDAHRYGLHPLFVDCPEVSAEDLADGTATKWPGLARYHRLCGDSALFVLPPNHISLQVITWTVFCAYGSRFTAAVIPMDASMADFGTSSIGYDRVRETCAQAETVMIDAYCGDGVLIWSRSELLESMALVA